MKRWIYKCITSLFICYHLVLICPTADTNFRAGTLIRDDEIESTITDWLSQLFHVAGVKNLKPRVLIIYSPEINAAATLGGTILIHTAFIEKCAHIGQFLGVMAHEVGHIAGGHVLLHDLEHQKSAMGAMVPLILGAAGMLAGGNSDALLAGVLTGAHVFQRSLLKFSRVHETNADQAAYKYLQQLGWSSQGLYEFFKIINKRENSVSLSASNPYARTHPLTQDRIMNAKMNLSFNTPPFPSKMTESFNRIKAKIWAFTTEKQLLNKNKVHALKGLDSFSQNYAQAILYYREGKLDAALVIIEDLLKLKPRDPFLLELKGQFYFEHGKTSPSLLAFEEATHLRPSSTLMRLMYAQCLIETRQQANLEKALKELSFVIQSEADKVFAWRLKGKAYGLLGKRSLANWALAEEAFLTDDFPRAKERAKQALKDPNLTRVQKENIQFLLDQIQEARKEEVSHQRRRR